jgi:hypothetical protein
MVLGLLVEKRRSAEVAAAANQLHYCRRIGEGGIREFEKLCWSIGFRNLDYHPISRVFLGRRTFNGSWPPSLSGALFAPDHCCNSQVS